MAWLLLYLAVGVAFAAVRVIRGEFSHLGEEAREEYIKEHGHEPPDGYLRGLYVGFAVGCILAIVAWPPIAAHYFFIPGDDE